MGKKSNLQFLKFLIFSERIFLFQKNVFLFSKGTFLFSEKCVRQCEERNKFNLQRRWLYQVYAMPVGYLTVLQLGSE